MTFSQSVRAVYGASIFPGRATRSEYWYFALFQVLITIAFNLVVGGLFGGMARMMSPGAIMNGGGAILVLMVPLMLGFYAFAFLTIIPGLAVAARRLHDRDMSALWLLLSFVPILGWIALLVIFCQSGTPGPNRFGPDPMINASVF